MLGFGGLDKRSREEETANKIHWDFHVFGCVLAMVERDEALSAVATRDGGVSSANVLLGKQVGADDGCLKRR